LTDFASKYILWVPVYKLLKNAPHKKRQKCAGKDSVYKVVDVKKKKNVLTVGLVNIPGMMCGFCVMADKLVVSAARTQWQVNVVPNYCEVHTVA